VPSLFLAAAAGQRKEFRVAFWGYTDKQFKWNFVTALSLSIDDNRIRNVQRSTVDQIEYPDGGALGFHTMEEIREEFRLKDCDAY